MWKKSTGRECLRGEGVICLRCPVSQTSAEFETSGNVIIKSAPLLIV